LRFLLSIFQISPFDSAMNPKVFAGGLLAFAYNEVVGQFLEPGLVVAGNGGHSILFEKTKPDPKGAI
jgi:hypothetical protein